MNDLWTQLATKAAGPAGAVRPRLPGRFETPTQKSPDASPMSDETDQVSWETAASPPHPAASLDTIREQPRSTLRPMQPGQRERPGQSRSFPAPLRTIREPLPSPSSETPDRLALSPGAAGEAGDLEPPSPLPLATGDFLPSRSDQPPAGPAGIAQTAVDNVDSLAVPDAVTPRPVSPLRPEPISPMSISMPPTSPQQQEEARADIRPVPEIRPRIAAAPAQPEIPSTPPEEREAPSVHVTIGRIEFQAAAPPQRPASPPRPRFQPPLTLDAYLKRRDGGAA